MPVYVQHEVLAKVSDVFSAEAIWQAPGLALFARKPLLRDLLERSPREHRGRAATRCFSHITLMLPQEEVDDDRHLTRGARARDLVQSLAALHQKDFGDLLGADDVRYQVVGTDAIAPGQVEVKFGHAVYLPAADEKILYTVSTSRDSAIWTPLCPLYPDQRLTLIGAGEDSTSHAVPNWPFGPETGILLINDGPDAPLEVQMRPKDAFDCSFDPLNGYYTIKSARGAIDAGGARARLLLKITRVMRSTAAEVKPGAAPAAPHGTLWKTRASTPSIAPPAIDATAAPQSADIPAGGENDATYAPLAQRTVSLVALALPRLSRYRDTGARALEIGLDQRLAPVSGNAEAVISFAVDGADQLYASSKAGRQKISVPSSFNPSGENSIRLLPVAPAMADRYCATVCLPQPIAAPVANDVRFVFGRGAPMLASLRVLDSDRHLQCTDGSRASSADRIGLSRKAFSFEAVRDGMRINCLSASQVLYHLDPQLQFVARIDAGTTDQAYLLPPGHHLVAGHYVLRLDA
jgi:hypothetical protein